MRKLFHEIRLVVSSPWQVTLFLAMPILLTLLFGLLFGQGIIENIRTVEADLDRSSVSQTLMEDFRSSRGFRLVAELDDPDAARAMVSREDADLVVVVPQDFSRDLKRGRNPTVLLMVNGANMAISSNAMKRASEIILTYNVGIEVRRLQAMGYPTKQAETMARPLRWQYLQLANPTGSFNDFLIWGLIGAVAHFPLMLFAIASLDRNNPGGLGDLLAKVGAFTLLGSSEILLCIALAVGLFPVTANGGLLPLLLLVLAFALAISALGLFIALAAPNGVIASQAGTIVVLPALLLSGYTWPMSGFPGYVRALGLVEPLTYFADPLRQLMLSGATGTLYWRGVGVLLAMAVVWGGLAVTLCRLKGVRECAVLSD